MDPRTVIAMLVVLGLYAFVSSISYTDEVMAERVYCKNYLSGIHPDYKTFASKGGCNKYKQEFDYVLGKFH